MDKKPDIKIIITTIVAILPMILGISNDLSSDLFLVFILPIIFAAINVFANICIDKYENSKDIKSVITYQIRWIVPVLSIISMSIAVSNTTKIESPIYYIIMSLIGIYVCSAGMKIIECKNEGNCTFKLPFFLQNKSEDGGRFETVSYIWIVSGLAFISLVYLRISWFIIGMLLCAVMFIAPFLIFKFMFKDFK